MVERNLTEPETSSVDSEVEDYGSDECDGSCAAPSALVAIPILSSGLTAGPIHYRRFAPRYSICAPNGDIGTMPPEPSKSLGGAEGNRPGREAGDRPIR